jgi:hypothetical protein
VHAITWQETCLSPSCTTESLPVLQPMLKFRSKANAATDTASEAAEVGCGWWKVHHRATLVRSGEALTNHGPVINRHALSGSDNLGNR